MRLYTHTHTHTHTEVLDNKKIKSTKGITLIALIVTIVILLILAGISIVMLTGENGIINKTKKAKEETEISKEKEIIDISVAQAMGKSRLGNVTYQNLQTVMQNKIEGEKIEVSDAGDVIEVLFTDSSRYYEVDKDGNISQPQEVIKDEYAGDITKGGKCDGSEEKPYEINCIEDLVVLSNIVNGSGIKFENGQIVQIAKNDGLDDKNIILTRSLNFKSKYSYADSTRTDFGNINNDDTDGNSLITEMTTGTGFVSIGFAPTTFFGGIFEGNGKNISNIMINNTERNVRDGGEGLFGVTYNNAKVMNITISGNINGGGQKTGGIVGYSRKNTQIINCRNKCNIKSKHCIGGITGSVEGTSKIINSCNMAYLELIESTNTYVSVGGIAGFLSNNYVINCYNQGNIKNNSNKVYAGAGGVIRKLRSTYCQYI